MDFPLPFAGKINCGQARIVLIGTVLIFRQVIHTLRSLYYPKYIAYSPRPFHLHGAKKARLA